MRLFPFEVGATRIGVVAGGDVLGFVPLHDMLGRPKARGDDGNQMTYHPSDVRTWATETGYPVPARGRLSYEVVTSYLKAIPRSLGDSQPSTGWTSPLVER